jgi:hypothetical protein
MKFSYRKQGPSGRGKGRIRYLVDAEENGSIRFYIGTLEGFGDSWTHDTGDKNARIFKSRKEAADDLAWLYDNKGRGWIFVLAIVKGLIEHEDAASYFGSTMGLAAHTDEAIRKGLLLDETPEGKHRLSSYLKVTNLGRKLYTELGLDKLPQKKLSRAYMWDWNQTLGITWISKLPT